MIITTSSDARRTEKHFQRIVDSMDSVVLCDASGDQPKYLRASAVVKHGEMEFEIDTAITINPRTEIGVDSAVFSTRVGQLPNNSLSLSVVNELNKRLDGKFVIFEADKPDQVNLVYTSTRPANHLDAPKVRRELAKHGLAQEIVQPIIKDPQIVDPWSVQPSLPDGKHFATGRIPDLGREFAARLVDTKLPLIGEPRFQLPNRSTSLRTIK